PLRKWLYSMLDAHRESYRSDEAKAWRAELFDRCPRVYIHAIQEFMCSDINSDPVLVRHVENRMKFQDFFKVVQDVNATTRRAVIASAGKLNFDSLAIDLETAREKILALSYDQ